MPNKFLIYLMPILIIAISIFIMTSGNWIKHSFGEGDKVYETVQSIEKKVKAGQWEGAASDMEYLQKAWHRVVNRIQFSVEREMINQMTEVLYSLKGSIEAEDYPSTQQHISYFEVLWDEMGR